MSGILGCFLLFEPRAHGKLLMHYLHEYFFLIRACVVMSPCESLVSPKPSFGSPCTKTPSEFILCSLQVIKVSMKQVFSP